MDAGLIGLEPVRLSSHENAGVTADVLEGLVQRDFIAQELEAPLDIDALVASAQTDAQKLELYTASRLTIEEARKLAPYQNATGMQVTSAVLAGMVWAIENPTAGIVETDEMDYARCLEVQRPYLGSVEGVYTDWNPLKSRVDLFEAAPDKRDPWQFANIIAR